MIIKDLERNMTAFWLWISSIARAIAGASAARQWARLRLTYEQPARQQKKQKSGLPSSTCLFGAWLTDTVSYYY
jgi:hypothetical protein